MLDRIALLVSGSIFGSDSAAYLSTLSLYSEWLFATLTP
jgi:hypothetical protein